jgi:hypothetical protein
MKRIITALFMLCSLAACEKGDIARKNDFDKSYFAWLGFKNESNNSYRYVHTGGSWTGTSWQQEITVKNGEVTHRKFKYTSFGNVRRPDNGWDEASIEQLLSSYQGTREDFKTHYGKDIADYLEWSEDIHPGQENSTKENLLTLEAIYGEAKNDWLLKRQYAQNFLETKNNGMISVCGWIDSRCADDCFQGITIASIEKL